MLDDSLPSIGRIDPVWLEKQFSRAKLDTMYREAEAELCMRGDLSHILRPHGQRSLHKAVTEHKQKNPKSLDPIVLNCHRRFGKSFWGALIGVERALSRPGRKVRYGMATEPQVKEVVGDAMEKIIHCLPSSLRPHRVGNKWTFQNPRTFGPGQKSEFSIHSLEHMRGNRLRGLGATDWVLDEVRDISDPEYLVRSVLGFHFVDALHDGFDPLLVLLSTPPESPAHPFSYVFIPKAERAGTYFKTSVLDNRDWNKEDEEFVVQLCGGRDTVAWRREALCELIGDDARLVCPEFEQNIEFVVSEVERPSYFYAYICADSGWKDHFGAVFGYIDFQNQRLVIEDEIFEQYKSMGEISALLVPKYEFLYEKDAVRTRWFADATGLTLGTFGRDHGIFFQEVEKHDKWASIARFRTGIQDHKIVIHPRCKNTILQARYGIKNKRGTDFERTEAMGHLDCLAALIYLYRRVHFHENPNPDKPVRPTIDTFIDPMEHARRCDNRRNLERMTFLPTRGKRR